MHYATRDKFLTAAFDVVKRTDPEIYAKIHADNALWTTSPDAMIRHATAQGIAPYMAVASTIDAMQTAFGWTLSDRDKDARMRPSSPLVFINRDQIEDLAPEKDIDPVNLAASVIVHEFYHVHQVDSAEQPAYQTQIEFSRKLGGHDGPAIVRAFEHTARKVSIMQGR